MDPERYIEGAREEANLRHFRAPDRFAFNFLPDEEVRLVSEGDGQVMIAVDCIEAGEHQGRPLYATPSGRAFTYDRDTKTIEPVFYKDIK